MSTDSQIEAIQRYTQDARQRALDEYWPECKRSMEKAIEIIDKL